LKWGASTSGERGPVVTSVHGDGRVKNAIGAHSGSYSVYRALAIAKGALGKNYRPDFTLTDPSTRIGPFPAWSNPDKIVSFDPWGAQVTSVFKEFFEKKFDIRPTIAITRAHVNIPELRNEVKDGFLKVDGTFLTENNEIIVTKAAIDPVWHLPGVAKRFGVEEPYLRKVLFKETGGMYPELVTRPDIKIFLPPIGGMSVYIVGPTEYLGDSSKRVTVRVHDECNGSDVFGSDICTCRPYLVHGIEEAIVEAQNGGIGIICYNRKEGRALGEVTKYLVYNARKRQEGGDRGETYFLRTECVAGVQDARFQELMPDVLHWLGLTRIDRFVSMSDMKCDAVVNSGIEIVEKVSIPDRLIPADARVEIDAKVAAGYYTDNVDSIPSKEDLKERKGRAWDI